jgi:hypothetical protein
MIDDPLEWLAVALDEDEPTIPDALAWQDRIELDDETRRTFALEDTFDDEAPEVGWELELEAELGTRPARPLARTRH